MMLSDQVPDPMFYYDGRFSNGPVWPEVLINLTNYEVRPAWPAGAGWSRCPAVRGDLCSAVRSAKCDGD